MRETIKNREVNSLPDASCTQASFKGFFKRAAMIVMR